MTHRPTNATSRPRRGGPRRTARGGGVVLEAILVLPMLLMLSFGAVEYGWAFYIKHLMASATYAGARAAIATGSTNANVQSAVNAALTASNVNAAQFTLTTSPTSVATATTGTLVTVTVTATWSNVGVSPLPVAMGGLPANKQITCSLTMTHE